MKMDKDDLRTARNSVAAKIGDEAPEGLRRLKDEWKMDKDDLRTFMCNGVAAKIADEALWEGLRRLKDEWKMDKDDLRRPCATVWPPRSPTRRCGTASGGSRTNGRWTRTTFAFMAGVAAKIADEALWDGLARLKDEWKMDKDDLRKFMCDSVAAKIADEALEGSAAQGRMEDGQGRPSPFMRNSVAARSRRGAVGGLRRLKDEWKMDKDDLRTFMCNGVAAKIADEARGGPPAAQGRMEDGQGRPSHVHARRCGRQDRRRGAVGPPAAQDEWKMDKDDLRTFMCDGVAAKIADEALWDGLARLKDEWKMDKDDLRTFMRNSVAAKIGDEALWVASGGSRTNGRWTRTTFARSAQRCGRQDRRRGAVGASGGRTRRWTRTTFARSCAAVWPPRSPTRR